eukprot:jgi/Mesvir1/24826/Mv22066-RA.1
MTGLSRTSSALLRIGQELLSGVPLAVEGPEFAVDMSTIEVSQTRRLLSLIKRRDVTNSFKTYDQGFQPDDKHYWTSLAYTGIWGYIIAAVGILTLLIFLIVRSFCACRKGQGYCPSVKPKDYTRAQLWLPKVAVLLFSVVVLVGCLVALVGHKQLDEPVNGLVDELVDTAADLVNDTRRISTAIQRAVDTAPDSGLDFTDTITQLNDAADEVERTVGGNEDDIRKYLDVVQLVLLIISIVVIVITMIGLIVSVFGYRLVLLFIFFFSFLFLIITWLLAGVFFTSQNFTLDVCVAMDDYLLGTGTSNLEELIPCVDQQKAQDALNAGKEAIKELAKQCNDEIDDYNRQFVPLGLPRLPRVCDPYGSKIRNSSGEFYPNVACPVGSVEVKDFDTAYEPFHCSVDNQAACGLAGKPLTNSNFRQLSTWAAAAADVLALMPTVEDLLACQFVTDVFLTVTREQCAPLRDATQLMWRGYVISGVGLICLALAWMVVYVRVKAQAKYETMSDKDAAMLHAGIYPAAGQPELTQLTAVTPADSPVYGIVPAGTGVGAPVQGFAYGISPGGYQASSLRPQRSDAAHLPSAPLYVEGDPNFVASPKKGFV